jgi:hypothetical protein
MESRTFLINPPSPPLQRVPYVHSFCSFSNFPLLECFLDRQLLCETRLLFFGSLSSSISLKGVYNVNEGGFGNIRKMDNRLGQWPSTFCCLLTGFRIRIRIRMDPHSFELLDPDPDQDQDV